MYWSYTTSIMEMKMLNKEICKKCHDLNARNWLWQWNEDDEKEWDDDKVVICRIKSIPIQRRKIKYIPFYCPYILEHEVSKNAQ
jgi:hypothetical protein